MPAPKLLLRLDNLRAMVQRPEVPREPDIFILVPDLTGTPSYWISDSLPPSPMARSTIKGIREAEKNGPPFFVEFPSGLYVLDSVYRETE